MSSPRRRLAAVTLAASAAIVLTVGAGSSWARQAKPAASTLPGIWSGHYSGAFKGTFTLHWKLSRTRLTGTIKLSYPSGTYTVTGSVHGSAIKFGAVGAGATYTGTVSGKSMSGHYQTPQGGGSWSANKTS